MHVSSIARRYGRSLARVAIKRKVEKTAGEELQGVWAFFRDSPAVRLALESPATSSARRESIVSAVAGVPGLTPYVANFVRVVVDGRRFHLFREMLEAYRQEVDRYHGVVEAEVRAAQPLDDAEREALRGTLQRSVAAGREVRLDLTVDPALIAGAVVRLGSVVFDGSLEGQLEQVRQQLVSE